MTNSYPMENMHQTTRCALKLGVLGLFILGGCKGSQPVDQMKNRWNKIEAGMDFNEVKRVLGPPTKTMKNDMDGEIVREGAYSWHVRDGDKVLGFSLSVADGKVRSKSGPNNVIPDEFSTPDGVIEKNASKARVRDVLGEPIRVNRFANGESWFYELKDGKSYIVTFDGDVVLSVTKRD